MMAYRDSMSRSRYPQQPHRLLPDPTTPSGIVLYAVIAGLIIWAITDLLSHIVLTWR
jgi:hypothetical protein